MTIQEEFRSRNFSIYGQWYVQSVDSTYRPLESSVPRNLAPRSLIEALVPHPVERIMLTLPNYASITHEETSARPQKYRRKREYIWRNTESLTPSLTRLGILCMFLCIALGIANFFHIHPLTIIFSIICLVSGLVIIFIEVPLLLRICPTSSTFDNFIRRFTTNYMRAAIYGVMSLVQWLSIIVQRTSLIAAAVFLLLTSICYAIAGLKGQGFVGSKTLGGQGVAQMIV